MTLRLPRDLWGVYRQPPQFRFGTVTSVSPGICTVRVAGGEIPVIYFKGAPVAVGDFVAVQRQGVASYLLMPPSGSPYLTGQTWWCEDPGTGRAWWLTSPSTLPNFVGSLVQSPSLGASLEGFFGVGAQSVWAFDLDGNVTGSYTITAAQQNIVPWLFPATATGIALTQAYPSVFKAPYPAILTIPDLLPNVQRQSPSQVSDFLIPTGAPCFDPANFSSAYSVGMFYSQRDEVVYWLGQPASDGAFFEWDALDPVSLNVVSVASASALPANFGTGTASGPDVGLCQIDQQTGYAWILGEAGAAAPYSDFVLVMDPKSGTLITTVLDTTAYAPLALNVDALSRTVFVVAASNTSSGGANDFPWYLQAWDADTYQLRGQTNIPSGLYGGSFTWGVMPGSGRGIFFLQNQGVTPVVSTIYVIDSNGNLVNSLPLSPTYNDFLYYFATLQ